jgi:hypothetical protein
MFMKIGSSTEKDVREDTYTYTQRDTHRQQGALTSLLIHVFLKNEDIMLNKP